MMPTCPAYRPDHNTECLICDEWYDGHTPEAVARGELLAMARDWTDPVVVRDSPDRAADVIAQLIADIERLAREAYGNGEAAASLNR